jgi:serine/threonine protein kinase
MMQLGEAFRTESGPDRRYYLAVHCLKQTRDDSLGFTLSEVWVCCLLEPIDISGSLFRQLPERYCLKITTQDALRSVRRMEVLRSRPIQERFMEECSIHQELHQRYGLSSAAAGSPTSARSGTAAPGLCPLVSIAADDDAYYLLTPYLGVDLFAFMRDRARRGLRVSEAEARSLFSDMVNSLIAMHRCGICHRDVSPQNFVVKEQPGTVRCSLIDFGMATRLDVGPNGHPAPLFLTEGFGKPEFIPPEQCLDLHMPYDGFKADVYSLGVTLFFMLTGGTSPPFTLPTEASAPYRVIVIENNLRKYFSTRGLCGERVAPSEDAIDLLSRMLRHRPEDRCSLEDVANHVWCRRTAPVSVLLTPTQQPPPAAPQRSIDQPQPPELKHLARTNLVSLSVNAFGESREGASALPELSIGDLDLSRSGNLERQSSSDSSQYDAVVGAKSASPIGFQIVNLARSSSGDPLDPGPPAVPLSLDSPPQATYAALYSSNPLSSSGDSLGTLPSKKLRR